MRRLKFVLAGLLFAPAVAFAQDGTEGEQPADPTLGGGAEAGAEVGTGDGTGAAVDGAMAGAIVGYWPKAAVERPYFRGKGKITVGGDINVLKATSTFMGMTSSATFDFITLRGAYAVTDQLSVGLNYALTLGLADTEFAADGPLTLWGGFQVKHDAKMSLAATAAFSIDVGETDNKAIGAGLGFRYTVADKIAVFTGSPYGPGPVGGSGFGGPLGQLFGAGHLAISINGADMAPSPITFDIPVGGMFQATPELNINVMTNLGTIAINEDAGDSVFFGADLIPLTIGGLFAVNDMIDAVLNFQLPDLKEAQFDLYVISVGARAHL